MMEEGRNPFAEVELEGGTSYDEDDMLLEENLGVEKKVTSAAPEAPTGLCSCLTVGFYKRYFDVDTEEVKERLVRSLQGYKFHDFVSLTDMKPDLYGPFWLCTTLIFAIGATANFASYLSFTPTKLAPRWTYDFTLLTGAAAVIYGFALGIPLSLWFAFRYFKVPFSLVQSICTYGYCHSAYIAAALLCMIPSNLIGWLAILLAFGISGAYLGFNLLTFVSTHVQKKEICNGLVGAAVLAHGVFACLLKLYFFKHIAISEVGSSN
jgi:protein YIPF1/2